MGRPNSLKVDNTFANPYYPTGYNWVQNVTYDYAGRRSSLQYWDGNWDGSYMSESKTWNGSGQLASVSFSSYALSGGMQYSYSATQNNGQITQAVDTVSGETIVYQYDLLKRLVSASATPTSGSPSAAWTETFQYDGFGNLTAKVLNGTSTPIPVNAATNQLTNAYYDANGNMTSGAGASFTYDASNRIVSETAVSGGNYGNEYAPDNKRIHQTPSSGTDEWIFYGANGEKLGVYSIGQWYDNNDNAHSVFSPMRTSVWFSGKLIYENGLVYLDRLGTNHAQNAQFLPYGDEITSTSNDRTKFATYTRDSYTGLDYADQRFYASTYGRFMTPDPSAKSAKAGAPGSWNRYSYAQGDPANRKDPRGLDDCDSDPAACGSFFADSYGEDNGVAFNTPNCGLLTIDYIDNQLGDDDVSCFDSPSPQGGGGSTPPPPPTCEQQLTNTITGALAGTPLAGEAADFVEDAQWGGLNPLLLVGIAGAESSYGSRIVPGSNNPFGLLHAVIGKNGKVSYVPINYANWNDSINAAVSTVDKQFVNGNVTVSEMYSGLPGAYCIGTACSQGEANVANIFQTLGGGNPNNPLNLLWPCKD
jgi:RHS repeat-associated protein